MIHPMIDGDTEVIWVPLSGSLTKSVARLDHRKAAPWMRQQKPKIFKGLIG